MQKPIEPGCLCVVIHPRFYGTPVTAIRFVAAKTPTPMGRLTKRACWEVLCEEASKGIGYFDECYLLRIDGGDPDAVQEETRNQEEPADAIA